MRVGLELFGTQVVRDELFPWIRAAALCIRPPERVALTEQVLRAYKTETAGERILLGESVISREMAHAEGTTTVYLELPRSEHQRWERLLLSIGYWGQASSFTTCLDVSERHPLKEECARPLQEMEERVRLSPYFPYVLSEFRDARVAWQEVVTFDTSRVGMARSPLKLAIYVWPLRVERHSGGNTLLIRSSFAQ